MIMSLLAWSCRIIRAIHRAASERPQQAFRLAGGIGHWNVRTGYVGPLPGRSSRREQLLAHAERLRAPALRRHIGCTSEELESGTGRDSMQGTAHEADESVRPEGEHIQGRPAARRLARDAASRSGRMPPPRVRSSLHRQRVALTVIAVAVATAGLQWAHAVVVPIALAILLTFVLAPLVTALERWRLPSAVAVVLVVVLALAVLSVFGWILGSQLTQLAQDLPLYRQNVIARIADLRVVHRNSGIAAVLQMAKDVAAKIDPEAPGGSASPLPVTVVPPSMLWRLPSLLQAVATGGFVVVLVIFMLLRRRDAWNRIVRLIGDRRLVITTKALDEMSRRISRYLVTQFLTNAGFGAAIAVALLLIGVPYAIVWGALGASLRFIPYVGSWIAALAPTIVSLAVFPGWLEPLLVLGTVAAIELVIYVGIEPWLYGRGAELSEIALLIAVAVWTRLWGPVGLVLSTPLTVCLAVLSKHVPGLAPATLLFDKVLEPRPAEMCYQRLVARDETEASNLAHAHLEAHGLDDLIDDVLLPAIRATKRDREGDVLTDADAHAVYEAIVRIARCEAAGIGPGRLDQVPAKSDMAPGGARIVACPANDEADETALHLLGTTLGPAAADMLVTSHSLLVSEALDLIERAEPNVVCVGSLPPGGLSSVRYLARRVRARFPDLPVLVGRWDGYSRVDGWRKQLADLGVNAVLPTLAETREHVAVFVDRDRAKSGE